MSQPLPARYGIVGEPQDLKDQCQHFPSLLMFTFHSSLRFEQNVVISVIIPFRNVSVSIRRAFIGNGRRLG